MSPFCLQIYDRPYPRFCLLVPGCCCCSVTQSSDSLWSHGCSMPGFSALHHLLELSQTHVLWVSDGHPTILSSVIPFSSYRQFFRASGSFLMSQLFASRGQSIGASALASVLLMNIQDWVVWFSSSPTDSQGVFSNTAGQEHQFFSVQASLWSNTYIPTWLLEKP